MSRKKIIRAHYERRIEPGRASHDVLDWSDAPAQHARFEVLVRHVALGGKSLLDVGCGLGDLYGFLQGRGIPVDYTGVDLVDKLVRAARRAHPGGRFLCADVFDAHEFRGRRFDVVFCSGAFNLNLGNNREFLPQAAARLMELAGEVAVFNLLHHRTTDRYDHCFYYDPAEVRAALKGLGWRVQIVEDYLPNDFSVICRKGATRRGRQGRAKKG
jgi:SAM-dependent methyltransferase